MKASLSEASECTACFWEPDRLYQTHAEFSPSSTRCSSFSCSSSPPSDQTSLHFPFCAVSGGFHVLRSRRLLPQVTQRGTRIPAPQKVPPRLCRAFPPQEQAKMEHHPCHLPVLQNNFTALLSSSCCWAPCPARHVPPPSLLLPRSSRPCCLLRSWSSWSPGGQAELCKASVFPPQPPTGRSLSAPAGCMLGLGKQHQKGAFCKRPPREEGCMRVSPPCLLSL